MHITILLGTARIGNRSQHIARALTDTFIKKHADVQLVDVRDHLTEAVTQPDWGVNGLDAGRSAWKALAERSDAFIFVLPEYNHGYPGEWKLLVDSTMDPYAGKPVAIASVSNGAFGGARVSDHVKPVLVELGLRVLKSALFISKAGEVLDDSGQITDGATQERIEKFVDTFLTETRQV